MSTTAEKHLTKIDPGDLLSADEVEHPLGDSMDHIAKMLGYYPQSTSKYGQSERTLLAVLREQDIKVFDPEGVRAYKRKYPAIMLRKERFWGRIKFFIPLVAFLAFTLYMTSLASQRDIWSKVGATWVDVAVGIGVIAGLICIFVSFMAACMYMPDWNRAIRATLNSMSWEHHSLGGEDGYARRNSYRKPIPKDVLLLAANLKGAVPNVKFTVEELEATTTVDREFKDRWQRRRDSFAYDPLLWVHLDGAQFCIAQWDQPGWDVKHI